MSDKTIAINEAVSDGATKSKPARANDLSTRERVNFVLSTSLMDALRKKATEDQVPMSRIIDAALLQYLKVGTTYHYSTTVDNGIPLRHLVEILLQVSFNSEKTNNFLKVLSSYFTNFTYSSCLFKLQTSKAIVGTKIMLYISDSDTNSFGDFLNSISTLGCKDNTKILLDNVELHF